MIPVFDPPKPPLLQPPVAVVFEAKWGVNKSNIGGIVRHPEGPSEVTPEVQITSGHILLVFLFAALFPWRLQLRRGAHRRLRPSLFTFARLTWWNAQLYCLVGVGLVKVKTRDHHAERQMPMQQFCLGCKKKIKNKTVFFQEKVVKSSDIEMEMSQCLYFSITITIQQTNYCSTFHGCATWHDTMLRLT